MIDVTAVNWLAVLVAAVASFILGGVWYTALFARPWMRYTGITHESAEAGGGVQMAAMYGGAFATYLVAVAALALLITAAEASGVGAGLVVGLLVGAGIVATVSLNSYLFAGRPLGLYFIDVGYPVVALALAGIILGAWR